MNHLSDETIIESLKTRLDNIKKVQLELDRLNTELKETNKRLEESEAFKSHFISNITNEIINPFTSIMGLSRSILSVKKEDWKRVISMVAMIHSEAFNLDFQFRNIFVAAKIEAGELNPEIINVDIIGLIKSTIDNFKIEAKKKRIKILFNFKTENNNSKKAIFKTDPEKVKVILSNLISNAIKFSFVCTNIEINANLVNKILTIEVRDYGIGISDTNQNIIFDRFKRLDSGINSINRGHGLGLSINKSLLDLLDGKIHIQSELNNGTIFKISIPEYEMDSTSISEAGNETFFNDEEIF